MKWSKEELDLSLKMINEGKTFVDISKALGRTQNSVTKKLNRLGYKSGYNINDGESKYASYDWVKIQKSYNDGMSYRDLVSDLNLTPQAIKWGVDNNKLIFRSNSEGVKLAWLKGKLKTSDKTGIERYRQLCEFKFNVYDYPKHFNLELITEYGWYKAKNRGDNPNGVSRDHMYSISQGFKNDVDPYYISHPANCKLMRHGDNNKKNGECSITLTELIKRVEEWDKLLV